MKNTIIIITVLGVILALIFAWGCSAKRAPVEPVYTNTPTDTPTEEPTDTATTFPYLTHTQTPTLSETPTHTPTDTPTLGPGVATIKGYYYHTSSAPMCSCSMLVYGGPVILQPLGWMTTTGYTYADASYYYFVGVPVGNYTVGGNPINVTGPGDYWVPVLCDVLSDCYPTPTPTPTP